MIRPRLLWLCKAFPYPPNVGGDHLYSARLVENVVAEGVDVDAVGYQYAFPAAGTAQTGGATWHRIPNKVSPRPLSLTSLQPDIVYRHRSTPYARKVRSLLSTFHYTAVVVDNLAMAWTRSLVTPDRGPRSTPLVYVAHNNEAQLRQRIAREVPAPLPKRVLLMWDAFKAATAERRLMERADYVTAITDQDRDAFCSDRPRFTTALVSPGYDGVRIDPRSSALGGSRTVCVIGSFYWIAKQANLISFLHAAYQPFRSSGISLRVVGDMPDAFRESLLARYRGIEVTGRVTSISENVADCRVSAVVERLGGGFKLKVLDSIFMALPLFTLHGSTTGTGLCHGRHMMEFWTLEGLVEGVVKYIDDDVLLNRLRLSAFELSEHAYDWGAAARSLLDLVRRPVVHDEWLRPRA